jgi:hypothetical protein
MLVAQYPAGDTKLIGLGEGIWGPRGIARLGYRYIVQYCVLACSLNSSFPQGKQDLSRFLELRVTRRG